MALRSGIALRVYASWLKSAIFYLNHPATIPQVQLSEDLYFEKVWVLLITIIIIIIIIIIINIIIIIIIINIIIIIIVIR